MPTPLIIDSDMAMDDYLALLIALRDPEVAPIALTVAATGEAHGGPGADAALRLAALAGRRQLPVAAGPSRPMQGDAAFPLLLRLLVDLRFGLSLPRPRGQPAQAGAIALLSQALRASPRPARILALGPLTNLGLLLSGEPELAQQIEQIVIMGGAIAAPGNIRNLQPCSRNTSAEWNISIDPAAAEAVLRSGAPIVLAPLDSTDQLVATPSLAERVAALPTPAAQCAAAILRRMLRIFGRLPFHIWDVAAAALALDPSLGSYREVRLRVEQAPGPQRGRTVEDAGGAPARACVAIDYARLEERVLAALAS